MQMIWLGITIAATVGYHVVMKLTPEGANPYLSLAVAYAVTTFIFMGVYAAAPGSDPLRAALGELATGDDALERQAREQRDLLAATGLAMLFVDRELRIQHHTPPLQQLIQVWPHDRGRPIGDLTSCLDYRELAVDLRQVVDTLASIECEVCDRTGRPFLVRLSPHRRGDEVVGAVATFIDIAHVRGIAAPRRAAGS